MGEEEMNDSHIIVDPQLGVAFIDDSYCSISDATISILDWGLTRSDCTYDVVHVWKGRFFLLHQHLDRFLSNVKALNLNLPYTRDQVEIILRDTVRHSGLQDAYVSMTCTRGRPNPGDRNIRSCTNTFYCYAIPFVWLATPDKQETGITLHISNITRIPPQSIDPTIKNYHWLDLQMGLWDAVNQGSDFVVLRDINGNITEGPGYNIFSLLDGHWLTPELGTLKGITRGAVIDLCKELSVPVKECALGEEMLRTATEVIATSTAGGIMPITVIDGDPVGAGVPGPETKRLRDLYWNKHTHPGWSDVIDYN
jgi:branched-chain amino acid aminotransferase